MSFRIASRARVSSDAQDFTEAADAMLADGWPVIKMLLGQPGTSAPKGAIAAAQEAENTLKLGYTSALGIKPLREAIAQLYEIRYGVSVSPGRVIVTIGDSLALVATLLCCLEPGQTVAIPYPAYGAQKNAAELLGYKTHPIYTDIRQNFQVTVGDIKALTPKPDALLITSPSNPTGAIIPPDDLAEITRYCVDNNILLISDEIYHGVVYADSTETATALDTSHDCVVMSSFSKYYSMPGWRVGWMIVPDEDAAILIGDALRNIYLSPPAVSQYAALAALSCEDELQDNIARYARNRACVKVVLTALNLPAIDPGGAFYYYVNISSLGKQAKDFCWDLLREAGVAIMPGEGFDPKRGGEWVRFSYAGSEADVAEAMRRFRLWLTEDFQLTKN